MSHYLVTTDKMAENNYHFGRKWQTKNLVSTKKGSTFVALKEKKILTNKLIKLWKKLLKKPLSW